MSAEQHNHLERRRY